ncbi:hypothetical protein Hanom_Chr15g01362151 [Helianthus anomalus]
MFYIVYEHKRTQTCLRSYSFSSFTKPIITFRIKIYQSFWILLKKPRLRDFVATPRGNESPVTEAGGGRRRRRVVRYDSSCFGASSLMISESEVETD